MAKIKLTKSVVDAATFRAKEYELRDIAVPGFLLKVTPAGRKIFMLQYRTKGPKRGENSCPRRLQREGPLHEVHRRLLETKEPAANC